MLVWIHHLSRFTLRENGGIKTTKTWTQSNNIPPKQEGGGCPNGGNKKPSNTWKTITEHPKKSVKVALFP
jgi:hypothetical protein